MVSNRLNGKAAGRPGGVAPTTQDARPWLAGLGVFIALTAATLLLRLPSLFEPPWHTDEGIFAAVAQRVLTGGDLYRDAWESKPPLFLYLYVAIFKLFGVGVLQLHLAATASAIASQWALYAVATRFMARRMALIASMIFAVLAGVPFWEGTLALTEIFAILPSICVLLCLLKWDEDRDKTNAAVGWLLAAGFLIAVAFLLRQTAIVVGGAGVLWLMLSGRPYLRPSLLMAAGFLAAMLPVLVAFAILGPWQWFWDANVGFFFHYIPSGADLPFYYRPVILLPPLITVGCLLWYRRMGETPRWSLPALWLSLTLATAMLTGRPYSHYMLQTFPPLALLVGLTLPGVVAWRPQRRHLPALALVASFIALWVLVVIPEFHGNPIARRYTKDFRYYAYFARWATGSMSDQAYKSYFDVRVPLTEQLDALLSRAGAEGDKVYIWGEYPWVYPLANVQPSDRYMTSFYVLLIPYLDTQLKATLMRESPEYIVTVSDARPKLTDSSPIVARRYSNASRALNEVLSARYEQIASQGKASIYRKLPLTPPETIFR